MAHICLNSKTTSSVAEDRHPVSEVRLNIFKCGGCCSMFETICVLHEHMLSHVVDGSYVYDHSFCTAFPKHDSTCTESQTDFSEDRARLPSNCVETQTEFDSMHGHVLSFDDYSGLLNTADSRNLKVEERLDCLFEHISGFRTDGQVACYEHQQTDIAVLFEDGNSPTERVVKIEKSIDDDLRDSASTEATVGDSVAGIGDVDDFGENCDYIEPTERLFTMVEQAIDDTIPTTLLPTDKQHCDDNIASGVIAFDDAKTCNYFDDVRLDPEYTPSDIKKSRRQRIHTNSNISKPMGTNPQKNSVENSLGKKVVKPLDRTKLKKCILCPETFFLSKDLKRHTQVAHSEQNNQCRHCNSKFMSQPDLIKHIETKHVDIKKKYSCPYCDETFHSNKLKSQHVNSEHPEISSILKKFHGLKNTVTQKPCEICGKLYTSGAGLAYHMTSLHYKKKFKCDICNIEMAHKLTLKAHKIEKHHENMRGFDCEICKKTFAYRHRLNIHMEQCHTPGEIRKQFICETCGYVTNRRSSLRSHYITHDKTRKQFTCELCPYTTYYNSCMKGHMISHSNTRSFICDVCGDKFRAGKQLKVHMRRHTGEMPYECSYCGRKFRTDIALARHRDIHLNKMRFKCHYCEKEFIQKTNCVAHMRQHTGEKPYKCDWCGQGFTHNVSRKNHMTKCDQSEMSIEGD